MSHGTRRIHPVFPVLIVLMVLITPVSFWLKGQYGTNQIDESDPNLAVVRPSKPTTAEGLYSLFNDYGEKILDDEIRLVLEKLESQCMDAPTRIPKTSQTMQASDPALAKAISDPLGTPFNDNNTPSLKQQLSPNKKLADELVARFLERQKNEGDAESTATTAKNLGIILNGYFTSETISPVAMKSLRESITSDTTDPIVLAAACIDTKEFKVNGLRLIDMLFESRKQESLSPTEQILVYSCLVNAGLWAGRSIYTTAVAEGIELFASVWTSSETSNALPSHRYFLFWHTLRFSESIKGYGNVDLLLALDRGGEVEAPDEIKHFIAYRIYDDLAKSYYESNSVTIAPSHNPKRHQEIAEKIVKHLGYAWILAPEFDFLPSTLMTWEMNHGGTGLTANTWFRHAIALKPDSPTAFFRYNKFTEKADTNPEEWLAFAERCAESNPEENATFWSFSKTLGLYMAHRKYEAGIGKEPRLLQLAKNVATALKNFSVDETHPNVSNTTLTSVVAILWHAGEFDDLSWLLNVYCSYIQCKELHVYRMHAGEASLVCQSAQLPDSDDWKAVHAFMIKDGRLISTKDLDEVDNAISKLVTVAKQQAENEAIAIAPELLSDDVQDNVQPMLTALELLESLALKSSLIRTYLSGDEITFSTEQLSLGYRIVRAWGRESIGTKRTLESSLPENDDPITATDSDPVDTAHATKAIRRDVGTYLISADMQSHDMRLVLPLQVDPPFMASADISLIRNEGGVPDPYGVGISVGPAFSDGFRGLQMSPQIIALPEQGSFVRDFLPNPTWSTRRTSGTLPLKLTESPFTTCTVKLEVYADGYRSYINDKIWEELKMPIENHGWIQVGRYCEVPLFGSSTPMVHYEIANLKMKALPNKSLKP